MHHILRTFSDEDADKIVIITAVTRKDNVASATARRASRKASNPPGCTILFSVAVNATSNLVVNIISNASVAQLDRVLGYEPSGRRFESSRMHHILRTFSDEDADKIVIITAGTRKDNVASATARRASRKASNPPGCTIFSILSAMKMQIR